MSVIESFNPFLGPQPYREKDRSRFLCRDEVGRRLTNSILAHPCVSLFGPSGAGKSSLMQAAVLPQLREQHGFRVVCVDAWLKKDSPLLQLAQRMFVDLELGDPPADRTPRELFEDALQLAELRSNRPILLFLDQLEQPLLPAGQADLARELLQTLAAVIREPMRGRQLVLSLREDYLGRLRDQARANRELLDRGFRLGPLTVAEMTRISCELATLGRPAQKWCAAEMRQLMLQMRTPGQSDHDDAEVQSTFAQIACRALWEERMDLACPSGPVEAEPLLHRYLAMTLRSLGPTHGRAAQRLLEEYLVAEDGSRTLVTQQQAEGVLSPEAAEKVLSHLHAAAVLRSEHHEGTRYFELGHDWLANKVMELKQERQQREQRNREYARQTRLIRGFIAVSIFAGVMICLSLLALKFKHDAEQHKEAALSQSLMAGARTAMHQGQPAVAMKLLAEVQHPETVPEWDTLALEAMDSNFLQVTLRGPAGQSVNAAAFSPDGQSIVTASDDGVVRIWDASGRMEPRALKGHTAPITTAEFSRDGQFIVTASRDGTARVWPTQGHAARHVFKHAGPVRSATFSPDSQRIVTVSGSGVARLWRVDLPDRPLAVLNDPADGRLNFAAFSPDGQRLVMTAWDRTARVWRARGSSFVPEETLRGHEGPVIFAAFSQDGRRLITTSMDGTAWLWRTEGPEQPFVQDTRLEGHDAPVTSATFSPDRHYIVTASRDGTARAWQWDGAGPPYVFQGHTAPVTWAAFSPLSEPLRLVTASQDGTARVWHADRATQPLFFRVMEHEEPVASADVDADGRHVVTASQDGQARVWETDGFREPRLLPKGHSQGLTSATFSRDGRRIVTTSWDRTAVVWRRESGDWLRLRTFPHGSPVSSAAFSPDGQRLVTATQDGRAWVWSVEDAGTPPVVLEGAPEQEPPEEEAPPEGPLTSVAFSPDGRFIVTAARDTTVRVWPAEGGTPKVLKGHLGPVLSVAFSRDGQRLITASQDGTVRVWNWRDAHSEHRILQHSGPVLSAHFSPDEQLIVTGSWDGTARVWHTDAKEVPRVLKGHEGPVHSAMFTRNGRIVTASWDGTARVWSLPENLETPNTTQLLQQISERNQDCLSPGLRSRYLGESDALARERYARCESDHGRVPDQATALSKDSLAAGSPSRM